MEASVPLAQSTPAVRFDDIDRARGLAIMLVVWGHIVARDLRPQGNEWYGTLNWVIYSFHMAFFFYLSGLVHFIKPQPKAMSLTEYWSFVAAKAQRLLPAYILFALVVFVGKSALGSVLHVDRGPSEGLLEVVKLLARPTDSFASYLWFILALFGVYAILPLLQRLGAYNPYLVCLLALTLHFVDAPRWLALDKVCFYAIFFTMAWIAMLHWQRYVALLDRQTWSVILAFGVAIALTPKQLQPQVLPFLALPALHAAARNVSGKLGGWLAWLGRYSFAIFLMNSIVIGLVKGVMLKFISWDDGNFLFVAPILMAAGLLVPVWLKVTVFPHWPWLDRITS